MLTYGAFTVQAVYTVVRLICRLSCSYVLSNLFEISNFEAKILKAFLLSSLVLYVVFTKNKAKSMNLAIRDLGVGTTGEINTPPEHECAI